jgi:uncharacterized protein (DUF885 family)
MRISIAIILTAAAFGLCAPAAAQEHAPLKAIADEYWAYTLEQYPVFAASLGIDDGQGRVSDDSLAAEDRRVERAKGWLAQLDAIDPASLSAADRTNHGILVRLLSEQVELAGFPQRVINFTNRSGWHQSFAGMADNLPFDRLDDYRSYAKRLQAYGDVHRANIAVANLAIERGLTLPCDAIEGYAETISGLITDDPAGSRFYEPFKRPPPAGVDPEQFAGLAQQASATIGTQIMPLLREHLAWYNERYAPKCAKAPGISAQPQGGDYYAFRIRQMTTTDMSADQIHQLGLSEVARIRAEMEQVADKAGYASREAFIEHLRTDPQYYAKTPEELMLRVARETKRIDGQMPGLFGRLPRLPYGIREIPAETAEGTTTAYYNPGSPEIGLAGTYYVNTSKLDQRPFWEIPALSVHEAVPGHHQQIALQQELEIPDWRRHGAFFTAFVEGWGLYSERLGIEMGLYDTPAKDMGRLSYEMWRACRLVVDTGIHSKGWSKARAIAYMTDNSALTAANIEAEVNRYIAWPGQALAYKIGELKIRELRASASKALGERFDLRAFHDVVLGQGAVPLDVLEAQVKDWIAEQQAAQQ